MPSMSLRMKSSTSLTALLSGPLDGVICDFKCYSTLWGYTETNEVGELVESWSDANQLSLIHDMKLPCSFNSSRWRWGYNPDLVFVSNFIANQCEKVVLDPIPNFQHRPIGIGVIAVVAPQLVPFRWCFNLKKANWEIFTAYLDALIKDRPASPATMMPLWIW